MRVSRPSDPRLAPLLFLRNVLRLPGDDAEGRAERKTLRRADIRDQVAK